MGSLMRDEELFVQTQGQQQDDNESDNVYLELAKAITERKCRIVQKKEKLKLMINDAIKLKEKLKNVMEEEKRLKKDLEEVSNQKALRVKNIQNAQKSCATLESTLCDLTNKVSEEKAETKRRKDIYDAAIKDAHETWESYKEQYESFPLAKKLREVEVEVKKVDIKIKQVEMDIADAKRKRKLKREIDERKFHLSVVKLAETYKLYQEKLRENEALQKKFTEMKNLLADIKSGKATAHQLESSQGSGTPWKKSQQEVRPQPEVVRFTVGLSGIQVTSPPPLDNEGESSAGGKLFDWDNLLSSTRLLGFSKTSTAKSVSTNLNSSLNKQMARNTALNSSTESLKKKTVGSSLNLTNLLRNKLIPQSKVESNVAIKRNNQNETVSEGNNQGGPPYKKMLVTSKSSSSSEQVPPISRNTQVNVNLSQAEIRKDVAKESSFDKENKENTNPKISNTSSNLKSFMSSLVGNRQKNTPSSNLPSEKMTSNITKKDTSQNLMNILSLQGAGKEGKSLETPRKEEYKQAKTMQNVSANSQQNSQRNQMKNFNEEMFYQNVDSNQPTQYEVPQILLEPRSPAPDLVPVEANSQGNSQGNILQNCSPIDFNLSGGSEFVSPDDEQTKMVYQRMMSQAPYQTQEYLRENAMMSQKQMSEQNVIRSQYFADSHDSNIPIDDPGYRSPIEQPFSPPMQAGESMNMIPSPPPATTGDFNSFSGGGSDAGSSSTFFMFSNKNTGGGTANKSVFDFF